MVCYFDSSVVLSIVLDEPLSEACQKVWEDTDQHVSSLLLEAECIVSIRHAAVSRSLDSNWMSAAQSELSDILNLFFLKPLNSDVIQLIHFRRELSRCRTLDALHLATAVLARPTLADYALVTLDLQMAHVASELSLKVIIPGRGS